MINYLLPLLWWNVIFFCFLCFIGWSNFIASAVFWTTLLEAVLQHIFQFLLKYPSIFFPIFVTKFSCKWQKDISFFLYFVSVEYLISVLTQWLASNWHYLWLQRHCFWFQFSISLLTWSANHTSTEENSVLTMFINVKECSK